MKIVGNLKLLILGILNLQEKITHDSNGTKNYCDGHAHHDFYCPDKMSYVLVEQARKGV